MYICYRSFNFWSSSTLDTYKIDFIPFPSIYWYLGLIWPGPVPAHNGLGLGFLFQPMEEGRVCFLACWLHVPVLGLTFFLVLAQPQISRTKVGWAPTLIDPYLKAVGLDKLWPNPNWSYNIDDEPRHLNINLIRWSQPSDSIIVPLCFELWILIIIKVSIFNC